MNLFIFNKSFLLVSSNGSLYSKIESLKHEGKAMQLLMLESCFKAREQQESIAAS